MTRPELLLLKEALLAAQSDIDEATQEIEDYVPDRDTEDLLTASLTLIKEKLSE